MSDATYPEDLRYTSDHEWVRDAGEGTVRVGITHYAQEALGDVVYVDLPSVGDSVAAEDSFGEIESTKSVSDLYSPVTGTVKAVNEAIHDDYEVINNDPFGEGWLFEVEVEELGEVMTAEEYAEENGV